MSEPSQSQNPSDPGFGQEVQHSHVSARVPEKGGRGTFSNGVFVLQGAQEFALDFVQRIAKPYQVVARVILPPVIIPRLVAALNDNLKTYMATFGPPPALMSRRLRPGGKVQSTFSEHVREIRFLAFSRDDKTLIAASDAFGRTYRWKGDLKLWDVKTGKERVELKGPFGRIWHAVLRPDGKVLAARFVGNRPQCRPANGHQASASRVVDELRHVEIPVKGKNNCRRTPGALQEKRCRVSDRNAAQREP